MRRTYIILASTILFLIGLLLFFKKTYLDFEKVCMAKSHTEFLPDAYVVINSQEKLKDFLFLRKEFKSCSKSFDFTKYTYIVVYGGAVKSMYYSFKTTYFNDKSASYAPHWNSNVLFINYTNEFSDKSITIYKVNKQEKLRGFYGN